MDNFNLSEFMTQTRESLMDKMPDRITDEVISNDPQDAPEATLNKYTIIIPITADYVIDVIAEDEQEAVQLALENKEKKSNLYNINWSDNEIEVDNNE